MRQGFCPAPIRSCTRSTAAAITSGSAAEDAFDEKFQGPNPMYVRAQTLQ